MFYLVPVGRNSFESLWKRGVTEIWLETLCLKKKKKLVLVSVCVLLQNVQFNPRHVCIGCGSVSRTDHRPPTSKTRSSSWDVYLCPSLEATRANNSVFSPPQSPTLVDYTAKTTLNIPEFMASAAIKYGPCQCPVLGGDKKTTQTLKAPSP